MRHTSHSHTHRALAHRAHRTLPDRLFITNIARLDNYSGLTTCRYKQDFL